MDIKKKLRAQANTVLPTAKENRSIKAQLKQSLPARSQDTYAKKFNYSRVAWACVATCLCIALIGGFGFWLFSSSGQKAPVALSTNTYVCIDINPSFAITLDENNNVVAVKPHNKDGAIVLYGESLVGMSLEDACDRIIMLSWKLGYLQSGGDVNLTIAGDDKDKERALGQDLLGKIDTYLQANSIDANVVDTADETIRSLAQKYGVSQGKMALVQKVCQASGMSVKKAVKLSLDDLNDILEDLEEAGIIEAESQLEQYKQQLQNDQDYLNLQAQVEMYQRLVDRIEEIMERGGIEEDEDDEEEDEDEEDEDDEDAVVVDLATTIAEYNALFEPGSTYCYLGEVNSQSFGRHVDRVLKDLEDEIDDIEDILEDYWDNIKQQYKKESKKED
ncbi:MAG: hypothetical protein ACI4M5_01710 [Christensenellales bacterium]